MSATTLLLLSFLLPTFASSSSNDSINISKLTHSEVAWIGQRIYQNECASKPENLIYWGEGEDFPSLGIGHFIWYPEGVKERFHETFPNMLNYVSKYRKPPKWLSSLDPLKSPWRSKQELFRSAQSTEYLELQRWLAGTQPYQAEFITIQFKARLSHFFKRHPKKKQKLQPLVNRLMSFKEGRFALIDYTNFKGIGNQREQYDGERWGLISVLEQLLINQSESVYSINNTKLLDTFVKAAKQRLQLRVKLAPVERKEKRWLSGWFKRLEGYKSQVFQLKESFARVVSRPKMVKIYLKFVGKLANNSLLTAFPSYFGQVFSHFGSHYTRAKLS